MNLSEYNNQELNMMVARIIYPDSVINRTRTSSGVRIGQDGSCPWLDWVNDRNLWAGIMVDNFICLLKEGDTFHAYGDAKVYWSDCEEDYCLSWGFESACSEDGRAVVETFIKMNQEGVS